MNHGVSSASAIAVTRWFHQMAGAVLGRTQAARAIGVADRASSCRTSRSANAPDAGVSTTGQRDHGIAAV